MSNVDFIVVGQGLAGSVLSMKLMEQGYSVMVVDKTDLSLCSKVAAGIWNPVVFKRLTKSWMIDELLPELLSFYRQMELKWNEKLITERHIVKLFSEQQEVDLWKKKAEGELNSYLDRTIYNEPIVGIKDAGFGYSKVLKAGNLEVKLFLELTRRHLEKSKSLLDETFDHNVLRIADTITYKSIQTKNIVFTEGHLIVNNPHFNHIPFKPAKGEVLTITSQNLEIGTNIINKNAFLMNLKENEYKLGATYDWDHLNDSPGQEAKEELIAKFKRMSNAGYTIVKHEAGVRPSVIDRRPVLGAHPKYKNLYVFNGLGTKGVMLAPFFAEKLADHILSGTPLSNEFSVSRFDKFFVN